MVFCYTWLDTLINETLDDEKDKLRYDKDNSCEGKKKILEEKRVKKKLVFSYGVSDAWFLPYYKIEVYDIDNNNVKCYDYRNKKSERYSILRTDISRIIDIVDKNNQTLMSPDFHLEPNGTYDGFMHDIFLTDRENIFGIGCDNLASYLRYSELKEKSPNAMQLIRLLEEIFSLLDKSGIDRKYYCLSPHSDE